jgi:hypothetical protein
MFEMMKNWLFADRFLGYFTVTITVTAFFLLLATVDIATGGVRFLHFHVFVFEFVIILLAGWIYLLIRERMLYSTFCERLPHNAFYYVLRRKAHSYFDATSDEERAKMKLKEIHAHDPDLKEYIAAYHSAKLMVREHERDFNLLSTFADIMKVKDLRDLKRYQELPIPESLNITTS